MKPYFFHGFHTVTGSFNGKKCNADFVIPVFVVTDMTKPHARMHLTILDLIRLGYFKTIKRKRGNNGISNRSGNQSYN